MKPAPLLEAVTVDGFGTLVCLDNPLPRLQAALRDLGVEADRDQLAAAFRAEVHHYRPRSHEGRDRASLDALRRSCVAIFLGELGSDLAPDAFLEAFMGALEFDVVPGARRSLEELRRLGLKLACVANWDIGLHAELERLELAELFDVVLTSADVGAPKPAPLIFEHALIALDVAASAAVHIGDEQLDCDGAVAAGMRFEPVPLSTLPARLVGQVSP